MANSLRITEWWIEIISNDIILENRIRIGTIGKVSSKWAISMFHHMLGPPHQTLSFAGGDSRVLMSPGECWDGTLLVV